MAKQTHGMTTREKNVDQHPGAVLKRKRRSKEEVERAKEEAAQRKLERAQEEKKKVHHIATLERRIAEEDLDQSTPLAKKPRARPLRRTTRSHATTPLLPSEEFEATRVGGDDNVTETEKVATSTELTETEQELEVDTPLPKKKKGKPSVRAAIELINKVSADTEMGIKNKGIKAINETDKAAKLNATNMAIDHMSGLSDVNNRQSRHGLIRVNASAKSYHWQGLGHTATTSSNPAVKNVAAISDSDSESSLASESPVSMTDECDTGTNEGGESGYTSVGGLRRQRLTSSGIVRVQDVSSLKVEATPNDLDDNELPPGCLDGNRLRGVVTPTYISWIAQHAEDPWNVADADALKVMRKIWVRVYRRTITVNYMPTPRCKAITTTEQRVRDTWRTKFGNQAILAVIKFFAAQSDGIYDSDEKRQDYAANMLKDSPFLYSDTASGDPKKYKGLFRGELVIKTLACHFVATKGAIKVRGLALEAEQLNAKAAVALSAAAVERAFYLVRNGDITIERLKKSDHRRFTFEKTLNEVTGKESNSGTAFSNLNWGKATRDYLVSVRGLKQKTLATILEMALDVYNKTDSKRSKSLAVSQDDLDDEPGWRANLVDLSDDGDLTA
ncbi:hypothetical protein BGW80DRAFT_1566494 [Lactifluus volemus]|nr:hypothetical protein BGW80DRAFT_1566494 [Lactifluus volemus]